MGGVAARVQSAIDGLRGVSRRLQTLALDARPVDARLSESLHGVLCDHEVLVSTAAMEVAGLVDSVTAREDGTEVRLPLPFRRGGGARVPPRPTLAHAPRGVWYNQVATLHDMMRRCALLEARVTQAEAGKLAAERDGKRAADDARRLSAERDQFLAQARVCARTDLRAVSGACVAGCCGRPVSCSRPVDARCPLGYHARWRN